MTVKCLEEDLIFRKIISISVTIQTFRRFFTCLFFSYSCFCQLDLKCDVFENINLVFFPFNVFFARLYITRFAWLSQILMFTSDIRFLWTLKQLAMLIARSCISLSIRSKTNQRLLKRWNCARHNTPMNDLWSTASLSLHFILFYSDWPDNNQIRSKT